MENNKKSKFSDLAPGEFLSETQYYKVIRNTGTTIEVDNERGFNFSIAKGIVEEGIYSANQFTEEKLVSRTELIKIFNEVGDTVFTVCFNKAPKKEDINNAIAQGNQGKILATKALQEIVNIAFKGEERILRGYLLNTETGFGRSTVIDLEAEKGTKPDWDGRIRQVDHRTLQWLIYKNVKYIVKK